MSSPICTLPNFEAHKGKLYFYLSIDAVLCIYSFMGIGNGVMRISQPTLVKQKTISLQQLLQKNNSYYGKQLQLNG